MITAAPQNSGQSGQIKIKGENGISTIIEAISQFTNTQRFLIYSSIIIIIVFGYYHLIIEPRQETLTNFRYEYSDQCSKLKNCKDKAAALIIWKNKMIQAEKKFNLALKALPDRRELPAILTWVSQAGNDAGLSFLLFQTEPEKTEKFYKEIPLSMKIEGRYYQIVDFFFQVANMNRIINIKNIDMEKIKDQKNLLNMSCIAVTYMFVDSSSEESNEK